MKTAIHHGQAAARGERRPWHRAILVLVLAAAVSAPRAPAQRIVPPPQERRGEIELTVLPRRDDMQLTVYNEVDLTLVRERRAITLVPGENWIEFSWAGTLIDPTSLELRAADAGAGVVTEQMSFPPGTQGMGRWLVRAEEGGAVPFEVTYFASGVSWRAFYTGALSPDESSMSLASYVRIDNGSGEDLANAQFRVVVGTPNVTEPVAVLAQRSAPYGDPRPQSRVAGGLTGPGAAVDMDFADTGEAMDEDGVVMAFGGMGMGGGMGGADMRRKEVFRQALSEYVLYTIEGQESVPNGWGKRLLSFEQADIPVEALCKFDEERWGGSVVRFISFANDEEHQLGKTPLPNGTIRVSGIVRNPPPVADPAGPYLRYVGAAAVDYIPIGEDVELELGPTPLVQVAPAMMRTVTTSHQFNRTRDISGWVETQDWRLRLTNTRDIPVRLEITRGFGNPYWELDVTRFDGEAVRHDETHARFTLELPPRSTRDIAYALRRYHGTRQRDCRSAVRAVE